MELENDVSVGKCGDKILNDNSHDNHFNLASSFKPDEVRTVTCLNVTQCIIIYVLIIMLTIFPNFTADYDVFVYICACGDL